MCAQHLMNNIITSGTKITRFINNLPISILQFHTGAVGLPQQSLRMLELTIIISDCNPSQLYSLVQQQMQLKTLSCGCNWSECNERAISKCNDGATQDSLCAKMRSRRGEHSYQKPPLNVIQAGVSCTCSWKLHKVKWSVLFVFLFLSNCELNLRLYIFSCFTNRESKDEKKSQVHQCAPECFRPKSFQIWDPMGQLDSHARFTQACWDTKKGREGTMGPKALFFIH